MCGSNGQSARRLESERFVMSNAETFSTSPSPHRFSFSCTSLLSLAAGRFHRETCISAFHGSGLSQFVE